MDILGWNDFMNIDDNTPIQKAIDIITKLRDGWTDAADSIIKDSERLKTEYVGIAGAAKKMLDQVSQIKQVSESNEKAILDNAKATEELAKAAGKNTEAQNQNKKAADDNKKAQEDLEKAQRKLKDTQDGQVNSLAALKKELDAATKAYYAMGDATDQSVKDAQLKKVTDLNKQYTEQKKILDDAKKSNVAAAGSYDAFAQRIAQAKKELKGMEGGLEGNSKEFKKLQKEVADGTKKMKDWDSAVGDNTKRVGGYKEEIAQLIPGFSGVAAGAEGTGKALLGLAANPVGLTILAIAAALGTLAAWFTRTETGGDKLGEWMERFGAIIGVLLDQVAKLGGALFEALSEPEEIFNAIVDSATAAKEAIVGFFEDPLPAIKQFGDFLLDNVIKRFEGIGLLAKSIGGLFTTNFGKFKDALKGVADGAVQAVTGITDITDKVADLVESTGLGDLLARADQIGKEIFALKDSLEDQLAALILKRAKTELQVAELLLRSKDKLKVADEDRYKAIKQVSVASEALLAEELSAAQKKVDIAKKEIDVQRLSLSANEVQVKFYEELNKAEAELIALKVKRLQEQKRLQQQEIAIIREIEKEIVDRAKREFDAESNLARARHDIRAKELQEVINDTRNTLEVRNNALKEQAAEQMQAATVAADQQQEAAKEAALARIELDADTLDQIYSNNAISIQARIQQERDLKEAKLADDIAYVNETTKITEELAAKIEEVNTKMVDSVKKNVFTELQADLETFKNLIDSEGAAAIQSLNDEFAKGNMSVAAYERERQKIVEDTNKNLINAQLDYLQQKAALLRKDGQDTSAVENEIAQARLTLSQQTTDKQIEYEQKLADAKKELVSVAAASTISIVSSAFEAEQMKIEERMARLQEQRDTELTLAGDNEAAKAQIANEYAKKEADLQKKQAESKRKQAIFDKATAVFTIGINTAIAVIKAVAALPITGGLPFSAIVAAIGALQIAAVLAKPIPQYAEGTQYSKQGVALLAELGPEIVEDRAGRQRLVGTDGPTLAYLPGGSKVYTADETARMVSPLAEQMSDGMRADANAMTVISEHRHDKQLARVFQAGIEQLSYDLNRSRKQPINKQDIKEAFREALEWSSHLDKYYK